MNPPSRVYRARLPTGLLLALPLALVTTWYAWSAYAALDRHRRATDPGQPITAELFQISLHDELVRDLRRLRLPPRPSQSSIPTYELSLTRDNLDRLGRGDEPTPEGEGSYVQATIRKDGEVRNARIRYRGGKPWHYLNPQKSMKVRIDRGELLDGTRTFNLLNDPTPFGLEDQIILDLAREGGLLTPEYRPVAVRINNSDMGVFRYEAQPDEGLLRRNRRMPGNMYSGDAEATHTNAVLGGVGAPRTLFFDRSAWRKVAFRSEDTRADERELNRLLTAIEHASHADFARFAGTQLALERYAYFDALDVVFGGSEHDWLTNHKFYVDPYTGRLEPVAWSFRGFQNEPALNLVDHPFLIRLKMTPGYLARRNRAVYELLTGKASISAIRTRVQRAFTLLAPELAADPYWDAYKLLPKGLRFLRQLPRPMSLQRWALASETELHGYAQRSEWLLNILEEPGIEVQAQQVSPTTCRIDVTLGGEAAYALRTVSLVTSTCANPPGRARLWADVDLDGELDPRHDVEVGRLDLGTPGTVDRYRELFAGARLASREETRPGNGSLRVEAARRCYTYFATTERCEIDGGALTLDNLVTGGSTRLELDFHGISTATPADRRQPGAEHPSPSPADVPRFSPGELSAHPWSFLQSPPTEVVELGPGIVHLDATVRYGAEQTVRIVPRTELRLGPGVSLICRGPLYAEGPISIVRADPGRPYGGVALQGKGTTGSRLVGLRLCGGSRIQDDIVEYTAILNLHDTSDILVQDLVVEGDRDAGDVLHANAVAGLRLHEVMILDAPIDGIDLELCTADLRGVRVIRAGDDGIDIGASEVHVRDSVLAGCTNNAVSAGEESQVSLHGLLIAGPRVGVLAKNASEVRISRSVVWQAGSALRTNFREIYYQKESRIGANELYAVRCGGVRDTAAGTAIDLGSVQSSMPDANALKHLRVNVLGLASWADLEDAVRRLPAGPRR